MSGDSFIPWGIDEAQRGARMAADLWDRQYEDKVAKLSPSFVERICRLCVHPQRYDYDIRILTGEKPRRIAVEVGERYTSKQVVAHRDEHLLPVLAEEMPDEYRQKAVDSALRRDFPFNATSVEQLDWCVVNFLALRELKRDDPKFMLKAVTEVRNTIIALSRMPAKVPELPAPANRGTDNGIAEFPEHNENLDNAFALSRVRNREEEAVDVTESRT